MGAGRGRGHSQASAAEPDAGAKGGPEDKEPKSSVATEASGGL